MIRRTRPVLGSPIDCTDAPDAIQRTSTWAAAGKSRVVFPCNAHSVVTAQQDAAFRAHAQVGQGQRHTHRHGLFNRRAPAFGKRQVRHRGLSAHQRHLGHVLGFLAGRHTCASQQPARAPGPRTVSPRCALSEPDAMLIRVSGLLAASIWRRAIMAARSTCSDATNSSCDA